MTKIVFILLVASVVNWAAPPDGPGIFGHTCAACHGLDGHGGEHAPDIATAANIRALTDKELTRVVHNGIPAAGMPGFGKSLTDDEISAVVRHLRVLQNMETAGVLIGNPARGLQLFFTAGSCSACHLMNGRGGFIGPDLSTYGKIHGEAEIRQAILEPNKNFDSRHAMVQVTLRDGGNFSGMVRNEDNFSLQMQSLDGAFHLVNKANVLNIKRETKSLMPADYAKRFSKSEMDDLTAFLITAASEKLANQEDGDN